MGRDAEKERRYYSRRTTFEHEWGTPLCVHARAETEERLHLYQRMQLWIALLRFIVMKLRMIEQFNETE